MNTNLSNMPDEKLWARQLKSQQFKSQIPLELQEKNLKEKMTYEKSLLLTAVQNQDETAKLRHFQILVQLRTKLLLLRLQKRKENFQLVNDRIVQEEAKLLARETIQLAHALNLAFE